MKTKKKRKMEFYKFYDKKDRLKDLVESEH